MGETKMLIKLSIIDVIIGVPLAFILIPSLGITGLIIGSTLIAPISSLCIGVYWTWKKYGTKPDFNNSSRILIAATIASSFTFLFLQTFDFAAWIMLVVGATIFLLSYIVSIPFVGAVKIMDLSNLRIMFSDSIFLSKILGIPIYFIEKTLFIKEKLLNNANLHQN